MKMSTRVGVGSVIASSEPSTEGRSGAGHALRIQVAAGSSRWAGWGSFWAAVSS